MCLTFGRGAGPGGDVCGTRKADIRLSVLFVVDAVALIVQIHLQQNRNDLAIKEVTAAKRWAQDNIIVNLAESWVGLRLVRPCNICLRYIYMARYNANNGL